MIQPDQYSSEISFNKNSYENKNQLKMQKPIIDMK